MKSYTEYVLQRRRKEDGKWVPYGNRGGLLITKSDESARAYMEYVKQNDVFRDEYDEYRLMRKVWALVSCDDITNA